MPGVLLLLNSKRAEPINFYNPPALSISAEELQQKDILKQMKQLETRVSENSQSIRQYLLLVTAAFILFGSVLFFIFGYLSPISWP